MDSILSIGGRQIRSGSVLDVVGNGVVPFVEGMKDASGASASNGGET
jgi:hypothetical protein